MRTIFKIFLTLSVLLILFSCSSSRQASYHYVNKQVEHGDLSFHKSLRVDEYINAFDQPGVEVAEGETISLQVDPFYSEQSTKNTTSLIQIAVKTGQLQNEEGAVQVGLCLVLDVSGSMGFDNKLADAKQALLAAVASLKNGDEFALVTFNNHAQTVIEPLVITASNRERVITSIKDIRQSGGTNIQGGLLQGYLEITKFQQSEYPRLLLITDGNSNINSITPEQLAKKLQVEFVEGIRISTVGLGFDVNQDLLRKIAKSGSGHFYFADKSATLESILKEDLASLTVPAAKNVHIEIDTNNGFVIKSIHGVDDKLAFNSASASWEYPELNVDDWRIVIVEVERSGITQGKYSPLEVKLKCALVDSLREVSLESSPVITWVENRGPNSSRANPVVARNSVLFGNAIALIQVGELTEKGQFDEALKMFSLQISNNIAIYEAGDSGEIEKEINKLTKIRMLLISRMDALPEGNDKQFISIQDDIISDDVEKQQSAGKSKLKKMVNLGLKVAETVAPGFWTTLARLISDNVF